MTISSNYIISTKKGQYIPTIGIECHVQLKTKTKLFSPANNDARGLEPNSCVSPIDYALPGMLPRLNLEAVKLAIRAGRAMNCEINSLSRFDRKHYFYPDSPKGYQITQFFSPLIGAGKITLPSGEQVRIEHAHLEGDAGKLTHFDDYSLVDLNRVDTPLIEIVSMPDLHSAATARDYCKELWRLMTFSDVSFGDLYNGNMRFDINISLAPVGSETLGTRAEIKNLNSFRSVERAVEYEIARQSKLLDNGEKIAQETRGWSDATGKTTPQRSKEAAADYRYMPEPDLPPLHLSADFIAAETAKLPLMPADYRQLFSGILPSDTLEILLDYPSLMLKLSELAETKPFAANESLELTETETLAADESLKLAEKAVSQQLPEITTEKESANPVTTGANGSSAENGFLISDTRSKSIKLIANLFASVLLAEENISLLNDTLPSKSQLLDLAGMNAKNELSSTATKEVFLKFFDPKIHFKDTKTIAKELNLLQENDADALGKIVDTVLEKPETKKAQADYKNGELKVLGFLVGAVMKESKGKANPAAVQEILKTKLNQP